MPETMVRKQVYIRPDQEAQLKSLAAEMGRTEAELIRDALDALFPGPSDDVESAALDHRAAEQVRIARAQRARGWRREDLYEERTSRWLEPREAADRAWLTEFFRTAPSAASFSDGGGRFDRNEAHGDGS